MSAVTDEVVNPHSAMNTTTHVPQPSICENSRVPVNPTCSPAIKSELLCPFSHAVDVSGRSFPGSDRPCQNRGASEEVLRGAVQDATPIAFGEARVGQTFQEVIQTDPKYVQLFTRKYGDSQKETHKALLYFINLYLSLCGKTGLDPGDRNPSPPEASCSTHGPESQEPRSPVRQAGHCESGQLVRRGHAMDPRSRVLQEQLPVKAPRLPSWPAQPIPLRRTTSSLDEPGGCGCKVELLALSVLELGISCFEVLNWDTFSGVVFW